MRHMVWVVVLAVAACDQDVINPGDKLTLGTWGGDNSGVIVTEDQVHVHIGCTFGDIPGRVQLDGSGRFTVDGTYVLRAFPIQLGPELPAQFSGRVSGKVLTLAVAVNDTVEKKVVSLGPVSVVYGRQPEIPPCPICVVPRKIRTASSVPASRSVVPRPNP